MATDIQVDYSAVQTAQGSPDYEAILNSVPVVRLDADMYAAEDIDGVTEGLFGSGNLNYLVLQSQQTNDMQRIADPFAIDNSDNGNAFATFGAGAYGAPALNDNGGDNALNRLTGGDDAGGGARNTGPVGYETNNGDNGGIAISSLSPLESSARNAGYATRSTTSNGGDNITNINNDNPGNPDDPRDPPHDPPPGDPGDPTTPVTPPAGGDTDLEVHIGGNGGPVVDIGVTFDPLENILGDLDINVLGTVGGLLNGALLPALGILVDADHDGGGLLNLDTDNVPVLGLIDDLTGGLTAPLLDTAFDTVTGIVTPLTDAISGITNPLLGGLLGNGNTGPGDTDLILNLNSGLNLAGISLDQFHIEIPLDLVENLLTDIDIDIGGIVNNLLGGGGLTGNSLLGSITVGDTNLLNLDTADITGGLTETLDGLTGGLPLADTLLALTGDDGLVDGLTGAAGNLVDTVMGDSTLLSDVTGLVTDLAGGGLPDLGALTGLLGSDLVGDLTGGLGEDLIGALTGDLLGGDLLGNDILNGITGDLLSGDVIGEILGGDLLGNLPAGDLLGGDLLGGITGDLLGGDLLGDLTGNLPIGDLLGGDLLGGLLGAGGGTDDTDLVLNNSGNIAGIDIGGLDADILLDPVESLLGDIDINIGNDDGILGNGLNLTGSLNNLLNSNIGVDAHLDILNGVTDNGNVSLQAGTDLVNDTLNGILGGGGGNAGDTDLSLDTGGGIAGLSIGGLDASLLLDPLESLVGDIDININPDAGLLGNGLDLGAIGGSGDILEAALGIDAHLDILNSVIPGGDLSLGAATGDLTGTIDSIWPEASVSDGLGDLLGGLMNNGGLPSLPEPEGVITQGLGGVINDLPALGGGLLSGLGGHHHGGLFH